MQQECLKPPKLSCRQRATAKFCNLDISEGQEEVAGRTLGVIDTTQLYFKKMQLQASVKAINSRRVNVANQIAVLRQQLETAKSERQRFAKLVSEKCRQPKNSWTILMRRLPRSKSNLPPKPKRSVTQTAV